MQGHYNYGASASLTVQTSDYMSYVVAYYILSHMYTVYTQCIYTYIYIYIYIDIDIDIDIGLYKYTHTLAEIYIHIYSYIFNYK